jgi:hypothetical protein
MGIAGDKPRQVGFHLFQLILNEVCKFEFLTNYHAGLNFQIPSASTNGLKLQLTDRYLEMWLNNFGFIIFPHLG